MHGLLLTLMLLQATPAGPGPSGVLFVEPGSALSPERSRALTQEVSALLAGEGLRLEVPAEEVAARLETAGEAPVASCRGQPDCVARLGRTLGVALVVRLKAELLADIQGLSLEAVSTAEGTVLLEATFVVTADEQAVLYTEVTRFARRLRAGWTPRAADTPLAEPAPDSPLFIPPAVLEAPPTLPAVALATESGRDSRSLAYVAGGGALVTAAAGLSFGLMGLNARERLEDAAFLDARTGAPASRLPRSEAHRLAKRANLTFTLALSSAVLSAALGTTAVLLW